MSTRAVIVVTGKNRPYRPSGYKTVRLYTHSDGYPTNNLRVVLKAIRLAENLVAEEQIHLPGADPRPAAIEDLDAETMADLVIAASVGWYGASAKVDEDWDTTGDQARQVRAVYQEKAERRHFGNQGDLEWAYLVDTEKRVVRVYRVHSHYIRLVQVDPRSYADELLDEYQEKERYEIALAMDQIVEAGWTINRPVKKRAKKAVN